MLMLVGTASTVGAVYVGLSGLRRSVPPATTDARRRVALGPTRLRYFEDENVLTLAAEVASDREGHFYIVYLPDKAKWSKDMPDWCCHRRGEIVQEIKRLTADERIKWVEYRTRRSCRPERTEVVSIGRLTPVAPANHASQADGHVGGCAPSRVRR